MTGGNFTCKWLAAAAAAAASNGLCNCTMHEWHQSLHSFSFSYLVLFIGLCNVYILCPVYNQDIVSFVYLCNDRQLIIMNSLSINCFCWCRFLAISCWWLLANGFMIIHIHITHQQPPPPLCIWLALKYMTGGVDSVTCKWLTPTSH